MPSPRRVVLVPHTHWDREWYLPFQTFRLRLVEVVDRVLELLEAEPEFVFTLDGQLATVDDYLELRPENEERIRALVREGRLAIGPWQILMDEFLVSGETIVRNLELGWARGEELGGAMPVGYLPDMFGHAAQLPQILRRAGIASAVVWRGVPASVDFHAFEWEAPDGSVVRAEYLPEGYGNAAYVLTAPERLGAKLALLDERLGPWFGADDLLALYGTDHTEPGAAIAESVRIANEAVPVELATLTAYMARPPRNERALQRIRGELRSAARANLLMGVTSTRVDVKAAAGRAERALERYAEPLSALWADEWPEHALRVAWRRMIENSAHDSICACSLDDVTDQVLVRFEEADQIAAGLTARAAAAAAHHVRRGSVAVVNPSPAPRADVVQLDVAVPDEWQEVALEGADGSAAATQEVARSEPLLHEVELRGGAIPAWLDRRRHGRELFHHELNGYIRDEVDGRRRLTFEVADEDDPSWLDLDELRREVAAATAAAPDESWRLRIVARPRRTLLARLEAPALGVAPFRPVNRLGDLADPVRLGERDLDNGLLRVEVEAEGTLALGGLSGVACLFDGGDGGDSYNYARPDDDVLVDRPEKVEIVRAAHGPVAGRFDVIRSYRWRDGTVVPIMTSVELRAGEPFVRLRVSSENRRRDHRLRLHVPLHERADRSYAEGQFAVVERGLELEGGYGEFPLPTHPASGFVAAGGIAVLLEHVLEYELVNGGSELALTLLRATGLISRNDNRYREDPAGPQIEIPGAQCIGDWSVGLALFPYKDGWREGGVAEQLERYRHPFLVTGGTGTEVPAAAAHEGLRVEGRNVVLTSLRRRGDYLELRLVNESPEPETATVKPVSHAREADLLGQPRESLPLEGRTLRIELGPAEIKTIQLRR